MAGQLSLPGLDEAPAVGALSHRLRTDRRTDTTDDLPGEAYCRQHSALARRPFGITLTPDWLVARLLAAAGASGYDTLVDCGAGSGRFALAAARACPKTRVLAVESHPEMLALLRCRVAQSGLASRVTVLAGDFRDVALDLVGRALFIGNPPYVRHHDITPEWKHWYRRGMASRGIVASQLAGLHGHFMLRAVQAMRPGDGLCFVTAAEWLDNGYGSALRALCSTSDVQVAGLWVAGADDAVFDDALVSAAVLHLRATPTPVTASVGRIAGKALHTLRQVPPATLAASQRWSEFSRERLPLLAAGTPLGEMFRITRGQVTGLNGVWVLPADQSLLPDHLTLRSVTRAREIIDDAVGSPQAASRLKRVADLPTDLEALAPADRASAHRFIKLAQQAGAHQSYVARHRTPWYCLNLRPPPAALVSYMGRRPPVFRANPQQLTYLNIAHGLYPRQPLPTAALAGLLGYLNQAVDMHSGRVYGGGLVKFEPGDVARLTVPSSCLDGLE